MSPELKEETKTTEQFISDELAKQNFSNGEPEQTTVSDVAESYESTELAAELSPMEKVINQEKEIRYDADAVQRLRFDGIADDLEITAEFQPESDERFIEFDKKSATRYTSDGTSADLSGRAEALILLFDDLCTDIEGFGEKPSDWKAQLDADEHKIPMIAHFVTVSCYAAPFVFGQTERATISERYFNNKIAKCRHFPRKKTVDDVKNFRKLQKIPVGAKSKGLEGGEMVVPGYGEKKGVLYDQMKAKDAEGYAGRVPLRDKAEVIDFIFSAGVKGKK